MSCFGLVSAVTALPVPSLPKLVLTNVANGLKNTPEFSCSDTIHGYLTLSEKAVGRHTIEGVWTLPNGSEIEHSKNQIEFAPPGRQTAYVWLMFQQKSGGLLGSFRDGENKGESESPYHGQWGVKVLWDGRPLIESKFNVKCLN